jgi:glycosyltransferase involved in cell wall biosynthesis
MSRVRKDCPDALYVVLGATHPNLIRSEGEAYRDRLRRAVDDLGLRDHVRFVDRFVGQEELGRWLQAADAFVTPYPNLDQIVSGTLSYALAAGRPVVSTPFAYASEVLSDGRGVIVAPDSPEALADGLSGLLEDADGRAAMGRRAYAFSRERIWPRVGAAYRELLGQVSGGVQVELSPEVPYGAPALVAHG